jgi:type VI secretion system secreted protein Hcp
MSLQMNIKIDGVFGDSKTSNHKGWAEVLSWNWGMTSDRKNSQSNDNSKTSLNELSIIKFVGIDSMAMRLLYAKGEIISNVQLNIIPTTAKRQAASKYMNIKMEDVVIKSIVSGGNNEDKFFKEHITFLFDRVNFEYSKSKNPNDSNDKSSEDFDFAWNVPENMEWKH